MRSCPSHGNPGSCAGRKPGLLLALLLFLPASARARPEMHVIRAVARAHQRDTLADTRWGAIRCGPGCVVAATALAGGRQGLIKLACRTADRLALEERRLNELPPNGQGREDLCRGIHHLSVCGLPAVDTPQGLQQALGPLGWSVRHQLGPREIGVSVNSQLSSILLGVQRPPEPPFTIAASPGGGAQTRDGLPSGPGITCYLTHPRLLTSLPPGRSRVQIPRTMVATGCVAGGRGQPYADAGAVAGPVLALCQLVGDEPELARRVAGAYGAEARRAREVARALQTEPALTSGTLQRLQDVLYFATTTSGNGLTHGGIHQALDLAGLPTPPLDQLLSGRHLDGGIPLCALPGRLRSGEAAICFGTSHFTLMGRLPGSHRFFLFDPEGYGGDGTRPTLKLGRNPEQLAAPYAGRDFKGIVTFPLTTDGQSSGASRSSDVTASSRPSTTRRSRSPFSPLLSVSSFSRSGPLVLGKTSSMPSTRAGRPSPSSVRAPKTSRRTSSGRPSPVEPTTGAY